VLVAGVPGKVRRDLSEAERAAIERNAVTYLELPSCIAAAGREMRGSGAGIRSHSGRRRSQPDGSDADMRGCWLKASHA
jgi:hypothetical protein